MIISQASGASALEGSVHKMECTLRHQNPRYVKYVNAYASIKSAWPTKQPITQEKAESLMPCIIYFGTWHCTLCCSNKMHNFYINHFCIQKNIHLPSPQLFTWNNHCGHWSSTSWDTHEYISHKTEASFDPYLKTIKQLWDCKKANSLAYLWAMGSWARI